MKLYLVSPFNPAAEVAVAVLFNDEVTITELAPAAGVCPLLLPKEGILGYKALRTTYPFTVAPVEGNVAADHDKLISSLENGVAVNDVAALVAGFDKVKKLASLEIPVPYELVAYPLK